MIESLTAIFLCQLLGEGIARGLGWPIPGPVLGLVLMLGLLSLRDRGRLPPGFGRALDSTGKGLLAYLSLLFIPAGVGVVQLLDLLSEHGTGLAVVLVVSTVLTLLVTVATFVLVSRLGGTPEEAAHE